MGGSGKITFFGDGLGSTCILCSSWRKKILLALLFFSCTSPRLASLRVVSVILYTLTFLDFRLRSISDMRELIVPFFFFIDTLARHV
jgi:hypothetical protein